MGYKDAYDNKNIVIDIKNKTTQAEIVKAYVPSAEQQEEINKAFSVLEKTIGQEQQEVEKATTEELKNLHQEIIAKAYEQYGNTLSGKITLKMMQDKLLSAATTLGSNDILTIDDNDHGLVFAVQVALARSKELGIVDGENRQKSEGTLTENALIKFQRNNSLPMSGKLNVATLTKLAHLLVEAEPQKPKVLIEEPKEEEEPGLPATKAKETLSSKTKILVIDNGYKDGNHQDIKIDIKNPIVNKKILDEYLMSPDKQKKINEKFSILEKALATGANQDVLSSAIKEYGIALSEGISGDDLERKLGNFMDKRKNPEKNDIGTAIKERPGILFAIQLALRVKYPDIIVDGESWENTRKVIIKCIKEKDPEIEQITLKDIYRVIYILWINLRPENSDYQNIPKVSEEEAKKDLKKYHLTSNIWGYEAMHGYQFASNDPENFATVPIEKLTAMPLKKLNPVLVTTHVAEEITTNIPSMPIEPELPPVKPEIITELKLNPNKLLPETPVVSENIPTRSIDMELPPVVPEIVVAEMKPYPPKLISIPAAERQPERTFQALEPDLVIENLSLPAEVEENKYIRQEMDKANAIMNEARTSTGSNAYKKEEIQKAKTILSGAASIDPDVWANMMLYARRESNQGIRAFASVRQELRNVQQQLADMRTKKPGDKPVPNPALTDGQQKTIENNRKKKVEIRKKNEKNFANQELLLKQKVEEVQKVADSYETIVDKKVLSGKFNLNAIGVGLNEEQKKQLIDAYVDSYFGPLFEEDMGSDRRDSMYSVYGTIINKDNTRTTVYNNRNTNTVEIPADNTAANSTPEVIPEMDIGTIVWTRKENGIIFKEPFYSDQIEGFLHYYKDNVVSASLDNSLKLSLLDPAKAKEVTGSQFTDAEQKELGRKAKIVHKNIPLPENIKDNLLAQALGADRDWSLKVDNKKDFYKYVALINIELSVLQIFKAFEKSITVPPKTPDRKTFIEGEWKKKIVPYLPFTFR